ncbi:hypothetical protein ZYGR_0N06100 [Zygosaccharomyces rouxii]|uniref:CBM21 domain-containing protein n=1 Tax=Zygosaccharomyces rouxii TaxID=4956 RepID=A0A1Q3A0R0_ZYGRO|nr:hypothetical protein ZYGR_0N06100 [Zygosaccharomyces rouxii]
MTEGSRTPSPPPSLESSVSPFSPPPPTRVAIRQLKSSLKLSRSDSSSIAASSTTSSSSKNVRFAAELTTVKKFDSAAEPISISTESSPQLKPIIPASDDEEGFDDERDELWFNNLTLLPSLLTNKRKIGNNSNKNKKDFLLSRFHLDYDSDSGIEDEDEDEDEYEYEEEDQKHYHHKHEILDKNRPHQFEVVDWQYLQSNVIPFRAADANPFIKKKDNGQLEPQLFDYLQGSNIRLHSLEQINNEFGKVLGLIYVNNLNFEKFIEIKLTFNNWKDIHYVTATYHRSITDQLDEFKFVIDLNVLKYSLQMRNLLYYNPALTTTLCPLDVNLCCRYDVNGETFYDNNNYENYQMKLVVTTQSKKDLDEERAAVATSEAAAANKRNELSTNRGNMFARDFLVTTTLSHSHRPFTSGAKPSEVRRFSEDTDYFNTSPLRHLYHNDTSLLRPAKMNEILLNSEYENDNDMEVPSPIETEGPLDISTNVDVPDARSVSDSTSSYSSVSSPSEDLNLMDNAGYYRYSSANSLSSLELNSDLPINHYTLTDIGMTLRNLADEDTFDDVQSIVTDTGGDVHFNSSSAPRNTSAETLITPGAIHRLVSSNSANSSSSNNNLIGNDSGEVVTQNKMASYPRCSTSVENIKPKDMDYQTFSNSYCFYNCPHN